MTSSFCMFTRTLLTLRTTTGLTNFRTSNCMHLQRRRCLDRRVTLAISGARWDVVLVAGFSFPSSAWLPSILVVRPFRSESHWVPGIRTCGARACGKYTKVVHLYDDVVSCNGSKCLHDGVKVDTLTVTFILCLSLALSTEYCPKHCIWLHDSYASLLFVFRT
jgi:hypothetical protein